MPQASKEASRDSHPSRPGWRQDPAGNPGREKGARGRESQGKHACCVTRRARTGCSMASKGEKGERLRPEVGCKKERTLAATRLNTGNHGTSVQT